MQSVARLLSQDQQNNLVEMDHLLMNQLRTMMANRAIFSSAPTSAVISTDLCVSASTNSFISKNVHVSQPKAIPRKPGTDWPVMGWTRKGIFSLICLCLTYPAICSVNNGTLQGRAKEANDFLMKLKIWVWYYFPVPQCLAWTLVHQSILVFVNR